MTSLMPLIPLQWVNNDVKGAEFAFGGGRNTPAFTYLGAAIHADFELTFENLAPYVTRVLDLAASLEGTGLSICLVEIKNGVVRVF